MTVSVKTEKRRAAALVFLRSAGRWVEAHEIAVFLDCNVDAATRALAPAFESKLIERKHIHGGAGGSKLFWRMARVQEAASRFSIDWPPGFVFQYDTIAVASLDGWSAN